MVWGNTYAITNNFELNGGLAGNLRLTTDTATLNGTIISNSLITARSIVTTRTFSNFGTFELADAREAIILGSFRGDVTLHARTLRIISQNNIEEHRSALSRVDGLMEDLEAALEESNAILARDENPIRYLVNNGRLPLEDLEERVDIFTFVRGDLRYTSRQEIAFQDYVVLGNIYFTQYTFMDVLRADVFPHIIKSLALIAYVFLIYLIAKKLSSNNLNGITAAFCKIKNSLIALAIGLGLVILVPVTVVLLSLSQVGMFIGLLIALLYALLLVLAIPAVLIVDSKIVNDKLFKNKVKPWAVLLLLTILFYLIALIPFVGPTIVGLVALVGSGGLVLRICTKKCSKKSKNDEDDE
ncbi:MAG: hypothetical protein FWC79_03785 [Oscillospiraceae bacterium]|nr:hypothetical protein [Oscillospiraceae bacterium]